MKLRMIGLVVVGLVVAGCGDQATQVDGGGASEPPLTDPAASDGMVTTRYPVMVIEDGDDAELCLGGVDESLPPQCSGA